MLKEGNSWIIITRINTIINMPQSMIMARADHKYADVFLAEQGTLKSFLVWLTSINWRDTFHSALPMGSTLDASLPLL